MVKETWSTAIWSSLSYFHSSHFLSLHRPVSNAQDEQSMLEALLDYTTHIPACFAHPVCFKYIERRLWSGVESQGASCCTLSFLAHTTVTTGVGEWDCMSNVCLIGPRQQNLATSNWCTGFNWAWSYLLNFLLMCSCLWPRPCFENPTLQPELPFPVA